MPRLDAPQCVANLRVNRTLAGLAGCLGVMPRSVMASHVGPQRPNGVLLIWVDVAASGCDGSCIPGDHEKS